MEREGRTEADKTENNRVLCNPSSAAFSKHQTTTNLNPFRRTNAREVNLWPT